MKNAPSRLRIRGRKTNRIFYLNQQNPAKWCISAPYFRTQPHPDPGDGMTLALLTIKPNKHHEKA